MSQPNQDVFTVEAEGDSSVSENDFTSWLDNEHYVGLVNSPSFSLGIRCKALDGKAPSFLTLLDLVPNTPSETPYSLISSGEISKQTTIDHKLFRYVITAANLDTSTILAQRKFVLMVTIRVPRDLESEFNAFYDGEHMPLLSKIPGWLRGRRYKLDSLTPEVDDAFTYLTIHEWDRSGFQETPEWGKLMSTPWTARMLGAVRRLELREFSIEKEFRGHL